MKRLTDSKRTVGGIIAALVFGTDLLVCLYLQAYVAVGASVVLFALSLGMAFKTSPDHSSGEVRKFGFIALFFFGCFVSLALWRGKPIMTGLFGTMCFLGLCCALLPRLLAPVQGAWVAVGMGLANGVNGFFLILAWYLVITPSAWIKRLVSGRPLPFHPDKSATTYWVDRKEPAQPRERFIKRY